MPARALDVELRPADGADVALAERGLSAVVPLHPQRELVGVGGVVPHPGVGAAEDPRRWRSVELQDPVDVVRAPVVDRPAGDRLLGVPCPARMLEAADERLDVEHLADVAAVDDVSQGEPVAVPPTALVHGDDAIVLGGGCDDGVGVGAAQAHRLLDHDVLAGAQQCEREFGVQDRRCGDDRDVDRRIGGERLGGVVGDEIGEVGTSGHEPVADRVGGGDEREPVGLGGGEAVQVAHRAERSVADDADAEVGGPRRSRRCEQPSDERAERAMSAQRVEIGDAGRDDPAGAEAADRDRRVVDEADAGGGGDLDAAVDRGQRAQRGGDRDLAVESAGGGVVGERDEPLGGAAGRRRRRRPRSPRRCRRRARSRAARCGPTRRRAARSAARSSSSGPVTRSVSFQGLATIRATLLSGLEMLPDSARNPW